jgi:hypothetical protein
MLMSVGCEYMVGSQHDHVQLEIGPDKLLNSFASNFAEHCHRLGSTSRNQQTQHHHSVHAARAAI